MMQLDGADATAETTKAGNTSDRVTKASKTTVVTVAQAVQKPQRIVVFSVLAGQDVNLMAFDITKKSFAINKDDVTT